MPSALPLVGLLRSLDYLSNGHFAQRRGSVESIRGLRGGINRRCVAFQARELYLQPPRCRIAAPLGAGSSPRAVLTVAAGSGARCPVNRGPPFFLVALCSYRCSHFVTPLVELQNLDPCVCL